MQVIACFKLCFLSFSKKKNKKINKLIKISDTFIIITRCITTNQARVIQKLDSAIQRINHYPVDK